MKKKVNTIDCPNCGEEIDVNKLLYLQLEDKIKGEYQVKIAEERKKYSEQISSLQEDKQKIETEREQLAKKIAAGIREGVKAEKITLKKELRKIVQEEQSELVNSLHDELGRKSQQLKKLNKMKAEIERIKREKDELKEEIAVDYEKKLTTEKEKYRKKEEEKTEYKILEKENIINQLKNQLQEAQRKADQGSSQLKGEIQELRIENFLSENFPLDKIEEIKKGVNGGDCIQIVNTRTSRNNGLIYYESKNTKMFQPKWIEKFKSDMVDKGADIGVLVTKTMPTGMDRMGQKNGIWICNYREFKGLCFVLRETVIQLYNAIASQKDKGDKMTVLYNFLTSNEFKMEIESIVGAFVQMETDLQSEKRAIQSIWKKREKQLHRVLLNTNNMYSAIKGIAGAAIPQVKLLEFPIDNEVCNDKKITKEQ